MASDAQERISAEPHCLPDGLGGRRSVTHRQPDPIRIARVNDVWDRHDDAVICVYDLRSFSGDTVIDIMRTHPMVIIGGILQQISSLCRRRSFCASFTNGEPDRLGRSGRWPDMEMQLEEPGEEIKRLQRCINDLVGLLALPAIWSGGDPSRIARTLLDVLVSMLHLDLAYVRLNDPLGEARIEMVRVGQSPMRMLRPEQFGEDISRWLEKDPRLWPPLLRNPVGDGDLWILPTRLGLQGEIGIIVAGSRRTDFPRATERLLLNVAANQAAIGLQDARLRVDEAGGQQTRSAGCRANQGEAHHRQR